MCESSHFIRRSKYPQSNQQLEIDFFLTLQASTKTNTFLLHFIYLAAEISFFLSIFLYYDDEGESAE